MHIPVLAEEIVADLKVRKGEKIIDGTMGLGGHTRILREATGSKGLVLAIEWDPRNFQIAQAQLQEFSNIHCSNTNYKNISAIVEKEGLVSKIDIVFLDLGISSPHVDEGERGFSFRQAGPLDMRFSPEAGPGAAEVIANSTEAELITLFRELGEEPYSRQIAKKIVSTRGRGIISQTTELASAILEVVPAHKRPWQSVTRIFQALRIYVNQELDNLQTGMEGGFQVLAPGGRLGVISYHSLEDRIVKDFFKEKSRSCICPTDLPICICSRTPAARLLTRKPITPPYVEIQKNPRARSAKLRILQKL